MMKQKVRDPVQLDMCIDVASADMSRELSFDYSLPDAPVDCYKGCR